MAGSAVGDSTASYLGDYHDKKILEVLEENVVFYQLGDKRPLATAAGNVITYHTETQLGVGDRLTEGVQPAAQFMTGGTKTATLGQFGDVTAIADVMAKTSIVNLIDRALVRFGKAAARTLDIYTQDRLFSEVTEDISLGVYYHEGPGASRQGLTHRPISTWYGATKGGLTSYFLSADLTIEGRGVFSGYMSGVGAAAHDAGMQIKKIRKIATDIESDNVAPFEDGHYVMVMHPATVHTLMNDPEWKEWNRYQNVDKMYKNEIGMVHGVRIIKSTNAMKFHQNNYASSTCYLSTILGNECFAITELAGDTGIKFYSVPFSNRDSGNVLEQNAFVGYKWTGAVKVLQPKAGRGLLTFSA